jgi:hypothetical protein
VEQQDDLTRAFKALKVTCKELETTKAHWCDWMSDSTWLLMKQRTSLRRAGARSVRIGEKIIAELHAPHLGRSEYQFRRTPR